jgi:hypothetical protein
MGHQKDAIVYCGVDGASTKEGGARLLSEDGAPSISDAGLLEIFVGGVWSPVCGIDPGAVAVACKSMGFAGVVEASSISQATWGSRVPAVGNLHCSGSESSLLDCSFERDEEVFCAPSEANVIHCAGDGDATGRAFAP